MRDAVRNCHDLARPGLDLLAPDFHSNSAGKHLEALQLIRVDVGRREGRAGLEGGLATTYAPPVSRDVLWKVSLSPVTGFSMVCPERIISVVSLGRVADGLSLRDRRSERNEENPRLAGGGPASSCSENRTHYD